MGATAEQGMWGTWFKAGSLPNTLGTCTPLAAKLDLALNRPLGLDPPPALGPQGNGPAAQGPQTPDPPAMGPQGIIPPAVGAQPPALGPRGIKPPKHS